MEIISVEGRKSILELSEDERMSLEDVLNMRNLLHRLYNNFHQERAVCDRFLRLISPFLKEINLTPKKSMNFPRRNGNLSVECEEFELGDILLRNGGYGHGFKYTPVIDFNLGEDSLAINGSYAVAPRSRTTLKIAKDIVGRLYPENGDGLEKPIIELESNGDPRIYVVSAMYLQPVLIRLKEVFDDLGNDKIGTLVHLHNGAEEQDKRNPFCGEFLRRAYWGLLEEVL